MPDTTSSPTSQQQQQEQPSQQYGSYEGPDRRSQADFNFLFNQLAAGQSQGSAELTRDWSRAYFQQVRSNMETLETLTSMHLHALGKQEIIREVVQATIPVVTSQVIREIQSDPSLVQAISSQVKSQVKQS